MTKNIYDMRTQRQLKNNSEIETYKIKIRFDDCPKLVRFNSDSGKLVIYKI